MKVCFIGNMNNLGYVLMRYLNYYGIDTDLLLMEPGNKHFLPEADAFNDQWNNKIIYVGWNEKNYFNVSKKEIHETLKKYDFIIGTDYSPMYCAKGGRIIDLFIPHGSDIFYTPFAKFPLFPKDRWEIYRWLVKDKQRKAIENARYISFSKTNPENEGIINRLDLKGKRFELGCPLLFMPQYQSEEFIKYKENNNFYNKVKELKGKYDCLVFHHSSHQWKNPFFNLSYKANDKLIHGFSEVVKNYPSKKFGLILMEYGPDVIHSKNLIKELGIEDYVHWFGTMFRKELVTGLSLADLGVGELGHSWLLYGVVAEFFAFSIPVMHHRKDELYNHLYDELYPMYDANSIESVVHHLNQLIINQDPFKETGKKANKWFIQNLIDSPIVTYKSLIQN